MSFQGDAVEHFARVDGARSDWCGRAVAPEVYSYAYDTAGDLAQATMPDQKVRAYFYENKIFRE